MPRPDNTGPSAMDDAGLVFNTWCSKSVSLGVRVLRRAVAAALFLLLLLPVFAVVFHYLHGNPGFPSREGMRRFLESQYVPGIGLLRASTHTYPDNVTVYIANDNVLAAKALAVLGSPLSSRVRSVLDSEYGGGWNGKIDILVGKSIPDMFYAPINNSVIRWVDGYRIAWERPDRSRPMKDWYMYSDLLVYRALNSLLSGHLWDAEKCFLNLTKMWDGYGFHDNAFRIDDKTGLPVYYVYKCALFVYLYKALVYAGSTVVDEYNGIYRRCLDIIAHSQSPVYGGIYTSYTVENGVVIVLKEGSYDMNTETTSIVALALYSDYPKYIGRRALES